MKIGMIWAQARNRVIGHNGQLPWHLPEDLAHFKAITRGYPVIMGRKTWDSLPARFKPLPGRPNLVVSSIQGHAKQATERLGASVFPTLEDAIVHCRQSLPLPAWVWVIGGAQLYATAMHRADALVVTHVEQDFAGDAFAPPIDTDVWAAVESESQTTANHIALRFVRYGRLAGTIDGAK